MLPFFPLLRRIRHGVTLGVRVIATDAQGRLLLVKHSYTPGWYLPGGGVDAGETTAEAARRELSEEAGIAYDGPLALHGVFFNPKVGGRDHVVVYRAEGVEPGAGKAAGLEILDATFFSLEHLPQGITAATVRRIAEWRSGLPLDEAW